MNREPSNTRPSRFAAGGFAALAAHFLSALAFAQHSGPAELSTGGLTPAQLWEAIEGPPPATLVPLPPYGAGPGAATAGSDGRPPCVQAYTYEYNPAPVNPRIYTATPPYIGSTQTHTIYTGYRGRYTMAIIRGYARNADIVLPGGQHLFVDTSSKKYFQLGPLMGPVATVNVDIPNVLALCNSWLICQGYVFDPTGTWPFVLSNAVGMNFGDCQC